MTSSPPPPGELSDDDEFFDPRPGSTASSRASSRSDPRLAEAAPAALDAPAPPQLAAADAARGTEAAPKAGAGGEEVRTAGTRRRDDQAVPDAAVAPEQAPRTGSASAEAEETEAAQPTAPGSPNAPQLVDVAASCETPPAEPPAAPEAALPLHEAVAAALGALGGATEPCDDAETAPAVQKPTPSVDAALEPEPAAASPQEEEEEPLVLQWSPPAADECDGDGVASVSPAADTSASVSTAGEDEPALEVSMAHLRAMMLAMTTTIAGLERATALAEEERTGAVHDEAVPPAQAVPPAPPAAPQAAAPEPVPVVAAVSEAAVVPPAEEAPPVAAFAAELAALGLSAREIETLSVVKVATTTPAVAVAAPPPPQPPQAPALLPPPPSPIAVAPVATQGRPMTTSEIAMAKIIERAAQRAASNDSPTAAAAAASPTASALGRKTTTAVARSAAVAPKAAVKKDSFSEITPQVAPPAGTAKAAPPPKPAAPAPQQALNRRAASSAPPPVAPDWVAWADAVAASSFAARVPATGAAARSLADALAGLDARVARAAAAAAARAAGTCMSGPAHAQLAAVNAAQAALAAQAAEVLRASTTSWSVWGSTAAAATAGAPAPAASAMPWQASTAATPAPAADAPPLPRQRFMSGGSDGALLTWRGDAPAPLAQRAGAHAGALRCLCALAAPPGRVASGGDDGAIRLWDVAPLAADAALSELGKEQPARPAGGADRAHAGAVTALCAVRSTPAAIVSGGADGVLRLWPLVGQIAVLPTASQALHPPAIADAADAGAAAVAHAGGVVALAALAAPCAFLFASAGTADRTIRFWTLAAAGGGGASAAIVQAHANAGAHAAPLAALAALPAGRLASASADGVVWLWSVSGAPARRLQCGAAPVAPRVLAPLRHGALAVGCADSALRLLATDLDLDVPPVELPAHAGAVAAAAALGAGAGLATAGADGSLALWTTAGTTADADAPPLLRRSMLALPQRGTAITALLALNA